MMGVAYSLTASASTSPSLVRTTAARTESVPKSRPMVYVMSRSSLIMLFAFS